IQAQAEIARRLTAPIGNGERLASIWEFRELLVAGGPQYVRPDVGLAGGLTHCKKIAAIAEAFHAAVVTHHFLRPVPTAAAPYLRVAAVPARRAPRGGAPARGRRPRRGGSLPVPEAPGLGLRIDDAKLAELGRPVGSRQLPLRGDGSVAYSV